MLLLLIPTWNDVLGPCNLFLSCTPSKNLYIQLHKHCVFNTFYSISVASSLSAGTLFFRILVFYHILFIILLRKLKKITILSVYRNNLLGTVQGHITSL